MEDINYVQQSDASPQTVMAATLCWIYINRIADNLNWLAESAELEAELRRLCQRLACHWEAQLAEHRIHDDVAARASNAKRPLFKVNDVETESREARQLASEVIRRAQHC
jgi:hypothetical protein